ncbi:MAG TPA: isocitrate/isopropylmalate dehydrogenase family protein, partial [Methanomassiliicoccales archaeon]|nr:isocitrate/isopropylmalate dehydrogenase family protein [Methanomassiliicoccales archaeon]
MNDAEINAAKEHFGKILREQLKRVEDMKASAGWMDYSKLDKLVIGVVGGDGIGPFICKHAENVL